MQNMDDYLKILIDEEAKDFIAFSEYFKYTRKKMIF